MQNIGLILDYSMTIGYFEGVSLQLLVIFATKLKMHRSVRAVWQSCLDWELGMATEICDCKDMLGLRLARLVRIGMAM